MDNLGQTRSVLRHDHLLQTPDTFVRAALPGMSGGTAIVHAGPALGAKFTQYTAELEVGGKLGPTTAQRFLYVLSGAASVVMDGSAHALSVGGFAYVPQGSVGELTATEAARVAVIEKAYVAGDSDAPKAFVGNENDVVGTALGGDEDLQVKAMMPDGAAYDFAVNTMTYQPGAALAMVEIHVMEHGLLMLEGGGIYRLGDGWYAVNEGDFIWMAPYCPQWFGALGKKAAKYLIYKDWNRHPLAVERVAGVR